MVGRGRVWPSSGIAFVNVNSPPRFQTIIGPAGIYLALPERICYLDNVVIPGLAELGNGR